MKKTNFDGIKKTALNNLLDEINFKEKTYLKEINKLEKRNLIKSFVIGFFIGLGILIIMNEMLGNPVYQYFLNK